MIVQRHGKGASRLASEPVKQTAADSGTRYRMKDPQKMLPSSSVRAECNSDWPNADVSDCERRLKR